MQHASKIYKPSFRVVKRLKQIQKKTLIYLKWWPWKLDNTFSTEMFPESIGAKSPEVFKKCYKVEPDGQTSFATLDGKENTGLHYVAMSYYLIR